MRFLLQLVKFYGDTLLAFSKTSLRIVASNFFLFAYGHCFVDLTKFSIGIIIIIIIKRILTKLC